LKDSS